MRIPRLSAKGEGSKILVVFALLLLHLQGPCVRLEETLSVAIERSLTDPELQGRFVGVSCALCLIMFDKLLYLFCKLYRLVILLLVCLYIPIQINVHIPRRRIYSLLYDCIASIYLLCGLVCSFCLRCERRDRDHDLILSAAFTRLRFCPESVRIPFNTLNKCIIFNVFKCRCFFQCYKYF
ncbi:Uncharacterised protein [Hungatella hathewayi]|uniref:Uncharacterized protein n=1 Tax=Hungatella hathewayi TaxID=154046 RepID=A0A6N3GBG1_9FIRM